MTADRLVSLDISEKHKLNEIGVFKPEDIVVLIFPDHGSRYMSKVYNDQWMEDQGFFDNSLNVNVKPIEFIK